MRRLFIWPLLNIAKRLRGISLGTGADMGPGPILLTSGSAVLLHVGCAHVDLDRVAHDHRRGR